MFKHLYNFVKNRYQFYIYNFYYYMNQNELSYESITDNFEIKLNYTLSVFFN